MEATNPDGEVFGSPSAGQQATPSHYVWPNENPSPSKSPTRLTARDLAERDRQAIAYSKAQLQEGDTLVLIKYPENCEVFDHTGFRMGGQKFRVHSEKLLATGSAKFAKLLSEWEQSKFVRRNGFSKGLPMGIKFVLDLTPPNEGDEAVDLISDLSCSTGVRHWYTAERRLKVSADVCGGKDEVAKPVKAKSPQKSHNSLIDALTDPDFEPEIHSLKDVTNHTDEAIEVDGPAHHSPKATLREREEQELNEVLERSKNELFSPRASSSKHEGYKSVDEIPEYCPVRHRVGIEKLLQLIEGRDPRFDSAPKVWTLFVLAKYFDCTKVVVDFIVSWVLREPNCQFMEILPEVTLKMGLGLEAAILARPAFAILVSEYALSSVSRECGVFNATNSGTNQFGRAREDIDEDTLDGIQAAAYNFVARIEKSLSTFCDGEMGWFAELPEYRKLATFAVWVRYSPIDKHEKESIQAHISELKSTLGHFVRGRILWCLNRQMMADENVEANNHRRAETYLKDYGSDFGVDVYMPMAEKEKLMTIFPYKTLRNMSFGVGCPSNLLFERAGVSNWDIQQNEKVAAKHGVQRVLMKDLTKMVFQLNEKILMAIEKNAFNAGTMPQECFRSSRTWHNDAEDSDEDGEDVKRSEKEDDWGLPATIYSPDPSRNAPARRRIWHNDVEDTAEAAEVVMKSRKGDELNSSATPSPESSRIDPGLSLRPIDEYAEPAVRERHEEVDKASTTAVMDLPIRSRDIEKVPLLAKRPYPYDPFVSAFNGPGAANATAKTTPAAMSSLLDRISNVMTAGAAFLSTQHELADPREEAIGLHSQGSASGAAPRPPTFILPTTSKKHKLSPAFLPSTKPHVPEDWMIQEGSPFFSLQLFTDQVKTNVRAFADSMLQRGHDVDFVVLTDTLLCVNDEEFKYLPLWAGGSNDGTGGVFASMVPEAPAGAGPSGPGPAYHTGYSITSREGTEVDFDGTSTIGVDTSIAADNGFSDYIDRRKVLVESESDFHSETFTDDTENYGGVRLENGSDAYIGKGKGRADDFEVTAHVVDAPERSETPKPEEQKEVEWDTSEEEEPFDYGDEPEENDGDNDTTVTL